MDATKLSRYLREGDDPDLRRRWWAPAVGDRAFARRDGGGANRRPLTDRDREVSPRSPPRGFFGLFDSDLVDASGYAYSRLASPDAFMMVVTYGVTAWLAGVGGPDRPRRPVAAARACREEALRRRDRHRARPRGVEGKPRLLRVLSGGNPRFGGLHRLRRPRSHQSRPPPPGERLRSRLSVHEAVRADALRHRRAPRLSAVFRSNAGRVYERAGGDPRL